MVAKNVIILLSTSESWCTHANIRVRFRHIPRCNKVKSCSAARHSVVIKIVIKIVTQIVIKEHSQTTKESSNIERATDVRSQVLYAAFNRCMLRESSLHVTNTTYSGLQEHRIIVYTATGQKAKPKAHLSMESTVTGNSSITPEARRRETEEHKLKTAV
jgi:hypothetical protein